MMMNVKNRKLRRELVGIELERVGIERERVGIEREQLQRDRALAANEKKFETTGAGTRLTALISGTAVLVSAMIGISNVWVSKIAKEKEIQLSAIQKSLELEKFAAQQKQEWDLSLAQFVLSNQNAIFNGTPQEQEVLAKIIPTTFPENISVTLLERLEQASSPPTTLIWSHARAKVETSDIQQAKETASVEGKPPTVGIPYSPGIGNSSSNPQNSPNANDQNTYQARSLAGGRRLYISLLLTALVGAGLTVPWLYERFKERSDKKRERNRKGLTLQLDSPHT